MLKILKNMQENYTQLYETLLHLYTLLYTLSLYTVHIVQATTLFHTSLTVHIIHTLYQLFTLALASFT